MFSGSVAGEIFLPGTSVRAFTSLISELVSSAMPAYPLGKPLTASATSPVSGSASKFAALKASVSVPVTFASSSLGNANFRPNPAGPMAPLMFLAVCRSSSIVVVLAGAWLKGALHYLIFSFPIFMISAASSIKAAGYIV